MSAVSAGLFLPGFAARSRAYADGLPLGWVARQPPSPRSSRGSLASLREWAVSEVVGNGRRTVLAGHSMGAALAVLAAVKVPEQVEGLLLIAPAGLPLHKPLHRSGADLARQLLAQTYRVHDVASSGAELLGAPRATGRLVRTLRRLDLSGTMARVRATGIPVVVVGCSTDTLTPPAHSRRVAQLLGAEYRELAVPGGHVWLLKRPALLAEILESGIR